jgi:HJR/Mrr/RecB family endonuclease
MSRRYRSRSNGDAWLILGVLVLAALYHKGYWRDLGQLPMLALKVGVAVIALVVAVSLLRRARPKRSRRKLDGLAFERYITNLLPRQGFVNIRLTERYDLGVDIIAQKGGVIWGIQVKHHKGLVKASAVREVVTALNVYGCQRAMVVTSSFFSTPAVKLAVSNHCVLIDGNDLSNWDS